MDVMCDINQGDHLSRKPGNGEFDSHQGNVSKLIGKKLENVGMSGYSLTSHSTHTRSLSGENLGRENGLLLT